MYPLTLDDSIQVITPYRTSFTKIRDFDLKRSDPIDHVTFQDRFNDTVSKRCQQMVEEYPQFKALVNGGRISSGDDVIDLTVPNERRRQPHKRRHQPSQSRTDYGIDLTVPTDPTP
jgi:hypothetical protein